MVSLAEKESSSTTVETFSPSAIASSIKTSSSACWASADALVGISTTKEVSSASSSRYNCPLCNCTNEDANVSPIPEPGCVGWAPFIWKKASKIRSRISGGMGVPSFFTVIRKMRPSSLTDSIALMYVDEYLIALLNRLLHTFVTASSSTSAITAWSGHSNIISSFFRLPVGTKRLNVLATNTLIFRIFRDNVNALDSILRKSSNWFTNTNNRSVFRSIVIRFSFVSCSSGWEVRI